MSLTIVEALRDRSLFGALPAFADLSSWGAWLVFLKATYGLPLDEAEVKVFCQHTGRSAYEPPAGGWREVVAVVGRQSGKTRIAATIAAFEAMTAPAEADGTETYAVLVAQDARGALRSLFSYARAVFDRAPVLERSVVARRAETLQLESGCTLAVYPCKPPSVRGIRGRVVVCDELAFYRSSEGYPTDTEMLRACRPLLAMADGRLIVLSSPYAQSGALYELHRKHFGRDDAPVLVWSASAPEMNPTLPVDYLARMEADDPEAYRSEVLGEFRAGISTLLDPDALADCVPLDIRERSPESGVKYFAHADPASGSGKDSFGLAIAHVEDGRAVLDVIRAWRPPFNPSGVIAEAAGLLRYYRLRDVEGDKYAPGFVSEGFRSNGIDYRHSERDRSQIYLDFLPLVNAGQVVLLQDGELLRELRGLERRRGASGRDRVDHRPGAHDDRAVCAAGVLTRATMPAQNVLASLKVGGEWTGGRSSYASELHARCLRAAGGAQSWADKYYQR
ncbi:MAG TPA: hypothetical protein VES67_11670 [Vicinamibacterales bacterium]|nr:hypothetical protein [Vicinamibacterales bacterium]